MSDPIPFTDLKSKAVARVAQPGELLFEFQRAADHKAFRCDLRDHGKYGIEAQFFEGDHFLLGRRFEDANNGERIVKARERAVAWANGKREEIETNF